MRIFLFISLLFFCSCKDAKNNTIENTGNTDSKEPIFKTSSQIKDSLKQRLIADYLKIPKFVFGHEDAKDYNNYEEFKKIDNLLDVYESNKDLKSEEKQLLAIYRFKRYLLTSDYDKALSEFDGLPSNLDLENYKSLLKGIAYLLKGESSVANEYFQEILSQFNDNEVERNGMCDKYYLISGLLGKKKIDICKNHFQSYEDFFSIGNTEIIREYVLNDIEL